MGRIQSAPERSLKARLGFFLAELLVSFFAHRNPRVADKSITAAVGSPDDLRSAVWRLWVQGDEVYFGATMMLPSLKVSYRGKTDVSCTAWVARACLGGIGDDPFDTLETCERTASKPARERGQGAPFSGDRRSTGVRSTSSARTTHLSAMPLAVLRDFEFLVLIVDDLEEEHPAQLLGVAIDSCVLTHDVLNGFDGGADRHGYAVS